MGEQKSPSKKILLIYPLIGLAGGLLLLVMTLFAAGAGHGVIGPIFLVFPFAMLSAYISDVLFFLLAILQFPAYLFFIARHKIKPLNVNPIAIILLVHVLSVILAFMLMPG